LQDDCLICKSGLEKSSLLAYDYIGAPWHDTYPLYMKKYVGDALVGNGGLSIRNPRALLHALRDFKHDAHSLFYDGQNIQEDVFFAHTLKKLNYNVASRPDAFTFSVEQCLNFDSFGFHKPWAYHNLNDINTFFDRAFDKFKR
jgi:hypothetical protein